MVTEFGVKNIREEWLPDWREEAQYSHTNNASSQQWAWEFLRRNPHYQAAWNDYVGVLKPLHERVKDGSYRTQTSHNINEFFSGRFGVYPPLHPSIDNCSGMNFERNKMFVASIHGGREVKHRISNGEVLLSFDLSLPIPQQIEKARRLLEHNSKFFCELYEIKPSPPRRSKNWMRYLRMLDAESSGATQSEMKQLVPISNTNNLEKSVSESLKRAKFIRDGDYLRISLADYTAPK